MNSSLTKLLSKNQWYNVLLSLALIGAHSYGWPNKWYLLILVGFCFLSWLRNKSLLIAIWHCYITIMPFQRSRQFLAMEILSNNIVKAHYYSIRFSDILFVSSIYLLIRNNFLVHRKLRSPSISRIAAIILVSLAAVAVTQSIFWEYALYRLIVFMLIIGHFFIFASLPSSRFWRLTLLLLGIHTLVMGSLISLEYIKGGQLNIELEHKDVTAASGAAAIEASWYYRPAGYFHDPNASATFLLTLFPLLLLCLYHQTKSTTLALAYAGFLTFSILLTGSRIGFLVLFSNAGILLYRFKKQIFRFRGRFAQKQVLLIILIPLLLITPRIWTRIISTRDTLRPDGGVDYRIDQVMVAFEVLRHQPLGIGLDMLQFFVTDQNTFADKYTTDIAQPHNIFAEIASGVGFLGLLTFGILIYMVLRRSFIETQQRRDLVALGLFLSLINYFAMANFYPYLMRAPLADLFWLLAGITSTKVLLAQHD